MPKGKLRYAAARAQGYRSGLEVKIAKDLEAKGITFKYEPFKIPYTQPEKPRTYTPDVLLPNGVLLELKGRLESADRVKMALVKAAWPDLDIRFLFSNAFQKISKQSRTTYKDWCEHKGFLWAHREIPEAWLKEPPNLRSLAALKELE